MPVKTVERQPLLQRFLFLKGRLPFSTVSVGQCSVLRTNDQITRVDTYSSLTVVGTDKRLRLNQGPNLDVTNDEGSKAGALSN